MRSKPFFSIVIPTYNRASFIGRTIASVLAQDFTDFELIIVDDGSTDGTKEEVAGIIDGRMTYIWQSNAERGAARNHGARLAKGQYVNFLDSDDLLYSNHLSTAFRFVERAGNSIEAFHLSYDVKDSAGTLVREMFPITNINRQILDGNGLSCNGVFVRRDILLQFPFNEDRSLASLEDWELWIRLSSRFEFFQVNEVTSTIVLHDLRSVVVGDSSKIKQKAKRFLECVAKDDENLRVFGDRLARVRSSVYMYVSLHLAMIRGTREETLFYLRQGLAARWQAALTKRFLVILRLLVLRW